MWAVKMAPGWPAVPAVLAAFLFAAPPTAAVASGFPPGVVAIHPTYAHIPQLAACSDGAQGAIIAWQETTVSPAGILRATRVLADGRVDPAWPAGGVTIVAPEVERKRIGVVPDAQGGGYVWWTENATIITRRITASGEMAPGWPGSGRVIGGVFGDDVPEAFPDGFGGAWFGWFGYESVTGTRPRIRAMHLGSDGLPASGSPEPGVVFGTTGPDRYEGLPRFAAAHDGGLWVAWVSFSLDPDVEQVAGSIRVSRITPSGASPLHWTKAGTDFTEPKGTWTSINWTGMRPHAIADAGDGGFWLLECPGGTTSWDEPYVLHRFGDYDGPRRYWPADGIPISGGFNASANRNASPRILPLLDGGTITATSAFGSESSEWTTFVRHDAEGSAGVLVATISKPSRRKTVTSASGELASALVVPFGWHNVMVGEWPTISGTYLAPGQPTTSFLEYDRSIWTTWYGDADIVLTGDGAAILVWSQDIGRHGLQATRLEAGGVLDVPPLSTDRAQPLLATFTRTAGVRVRLAFEGTNEVRLRLIDVSGREVARSSAPPDGEALLPGSEHLPSGLYFVQASAQDRMARARVVVAR